METVLVLGDQLDRGRGALGTVRAGRARVLMVESEAMIASRSVHRQRLHLVLAGLRRLARDLEREGVEVDYRRARTLADGLAAHRRTYRPSRVRASAPMSFDGRRRLARLEVELVAADPFLCSAEEFADFARGRRRLRMEDFYRWQRRRLGILMDGGEPVGGRWNYDAENRARPPRDGRAWPVPTRRALDDVDRSVIDRLPRRAFGAPPDGLWPTDRSEALRRLAWVVEEVLPIFGPHQDAMLAGEPFLAHSLLSPALNLGLLRPGEVVEAVEAAYRDGRVPLASAEGFLRQVIGWREYVWGRYWQLMPDYRAENALSADRPLPPAFFGAPTEMRCLREVLAVVARFGWAHHIQRLMVLGNLSLLAGVAPLALVAWMQASFVDGAEWVMLPNVIGMALYADGGVMATKPYAAGGAYLARMSNYCDGCRFDPTRRTGPTACPVTTLYWDFFLRHAARLAANPRVGPQVQVALRLGDQAEIRRRAAEVLESLAAGDL